jgi:uncharacterized protein YdaL
MANAPVTTANWELAPAGPPAPATLEDPHHAASVTDYRAIGARFATRWERSLYCGAVLSGAPPTTATSPGQFFPYVGDVYRTKVLPENLGSIEPEPFYSSPTRSPADLIDTAQKNLVVRDGFASFFFHPFLDLDYLKHRRHPGRRVHHRRPGVAVRPGYGAGGTGATSNWSRCPRRPM